ncbi:DnaJ family domain-containing protein [Nonomuraea sp. NPDC003727]
MTDRFETLIDRQIREAQERGEFDDLPGAGKPLPNRDELNDELWWVKRKLAGARRGGGS